MADTPLHLPLFKLGRLIVSLKPELIDALGVEALKFIDDNFAAQAFRGATTEPWPQRKRQDKRRGRKILVDTGALRRSFAKTDHSSHTEVHTDSPYAQVPHLGLVCYEDAMAVRLQRT